MKEREVKSEERGAKHFNPRRNLSKENFEQRPIAQVHPENQNKKLYYLEFLSGQPVWGIVKRGRNNDLNENTEREVHSNLPSKEKYRDLKYIRNKPRPKVNILKNKKGKIFCNFDEYKTKNFKSMKNVPQQYSEKPEIPNDENQS